MSRIERIPIFIERTVAEIAIECDLLIEKIRSVSVVVFHCLRDITNRTITFFFRKKKITPVKTESIPHRQINLADGSVIVHNNKTNKYIYISKAPLIRNLVISGGGAKGVILPSVIRAFEDYRGEEGSFRDQLENIAGTSIGAVTAVLVAIGMPAQAIFDSLDGQDFHLLLGKGIGPVYKNGVPLLDFMRKCLQTTITQHLMRICNVKDINDIIIDPDKEGAVRNLGCVLTELKKTDVSNVSITFSMLKTLRELDPVVFKDLTVTATCSEIGKPLYFNVQNTPNLDIAIACRASASLPVVFSPVKIERHFLVPAYEKLLGNREILTFIDGGYFDNIPVSSMENKQEKVLNNRGVEGQNLQTLALVFDSKRSSKSPQSYLFNEVHRGFLFKNPKRWTSRFLDRIARFFANVSSEISYTEIKEGGLQEIRRKYSHRTIPLKVALKTTDFKKAKKVQEEYNKIGYQQASEFLELHKGECIAHHFDDLDSLLARVPASVAEDVRREFSLKH